MRGPLLHARRAIARAESSGFPTVPAIVALGIGMNAGDDYLLSVPKDFDLLLAAVRAVKRPTIFLNGSSVRRRIARFGARPNLVMMSPCSPNLSRAKASIASAASGIMMSMSRAGALA